MHFMTATPLAAKAGGNRAHRDDTLPYGSLVGLFCIARWGPHHGPEWGNDGSGRLYALQGYPLSVVQPGAWSRRRLWPVVLAAAPSAAPPVTLPPSPG